MIPRKNDVMFLSSGSNHRRMESESGKRTTVVIACTTQETVRVSEPALYYEADVLHLIFQRGSGERAGLYESLVEEIKTQISERGIWTYRCTMPWCTGTAPC